MKVPLCHFLFLHHFILLYANIDVEQIPKQNIVEVAENMSRILRFRITGEDVTNIIIKYQVNETTSHYPKQAPNFNALYTSTLVACSSGSSLQCQELQILVQGRSEIHNTTFRIQTFNIALDGKIQEIETDESFTVHLQQVPNTITAGTSPSPATEAPTYQNTPTAPQTSSPPTSTNLSTSATSHTTYTPPSCPKSTSKSDFMSGSLVDSTNLTLLITMGALVMAFAVSFTLNVILGCRLRRHQELEMSNKISEPQI